MKTEEKLNMTMLCDFYELTMGNGYFQTGFKDRITYFDVYFRSVPDGGGFAIAAGLEQLIEYIEDLHFDEQDIAYLRGKGIFCEEFLEYLRTFRFTGDIYAVPEGTPVFPKEPMVIVRAPAIEAQLVETFALLTVNHQSLIATKANRIARAAKGRGVMEFGSRRAQGTAAALVGARAAYIGDIAYLSRKAREMLDEAGWETATITVSNSLDEYIIRDMWMQDAKIDSFGVGERLITARSEPVFGCVYKLVAVEDKDGNVVPKIKISENVGKITTPHFKKLYRFYGRDTGKAIADYLCVYDETVDDSDRMTIFDPEATWKRKEVYHFEARELLVPIFKNGELVYKQPSLEEIRAYCAAQVDTLWDEVKRFDNPHRYYVDLSQKLYDIKQELLTKNGSH